MDDVTVKIGSGKTPSGGENAYVDDESLIRSQNGMISKVDFETDIVYIDESDNR